MDDFLVFARSREAAGKKVIPRSCGCEGRGAERPHRLARQVIEWRLRSDSLEGLGSD